MHLQKRIIFDKNRLMRYRLENDISRQELAQLIDTSPSVISRWENGQRTPVVTSVNKLVEATGIPHEKLYLVNDKTFGAKITTLRLQNNISQTQIADILGTAVENVNRWEADKHTPSAYYIYRFSKIFNISMEELITDSEGELIISDAWGS